MLLTLYGGVAAAMVGLAFLPPLPVAVGLLFAGMGLLGMGNGSVFQLVPQRFAGRMGIITGVVGAAGGLGGFFLPSLLGAAKDATGTYGSGLMVVSGAFVAGAIVLLELGSRWMARWQPDAIKQSGLFSYKTAIGSAVLSGPRPRG